MRSPVIIAIALALALSPSIARADADDFGRHDTECHAAIDAADYPGMAAYCALASEDLAMKSARYPQSSGLYAIAQVLRAQILVFAGQGNAHFNPDRAAAQFHAAAGLANGAIASGKLTPSLVEDAHLVLNLVDQNLADLR